MLTVTVPLPVALPVVFVALSVPLLMVVPPVLGRAVESVRVPVPCLVRLPPVPFSAPAKLVLLLFPPVMRFFAPSDTVEPLAPARLPMVSLLAVMAVMSKVAVLLFTFTATLSWIEPEPLRARMPPLMVAGPVKVFAAVRVREREALLLATVMPPLETTPPNVAELATVMVRVAPPRLVVPLLVRVLPSPPSVKSPPTETLLVIVRGEPEAASAPPLMLKALPLSAELLPRPRVPALSVTVPVKVFA